VWSLSGVHRAFDASHAVSSRMRMLRCANQTLPGSSMRTLRIGLSYNALARMYESMFTRRRIRAQGNDSRSRGNVWFFYNATARADVPSHAFFHPLWSVGRGGRVVVEGATSGYSSGSLTGNTRRVGATGTALAPRFADVARDRKSLFFFPFSLWQWQISIRLTRGRS